MLSNDIISEIIGGLCGIFGTKLDCIILYGSVVRGEETNESDIDIVMVLNRSITEQEKDKFLEWNASLDLKFDKVFSIIDVEKNTMEKWQNIVPFYKNIINEGVVLWKAA